MTEGITSSPIQEHFSPILETALGAIDRVEPVPRWQRARETAQRVSRFVGDPIVLGTLLALTLGPDLEAQIAAQSGPVYEALQQIDRSIQALPAGRQILEIVGHAAYMVNPDLIDPTEAPMVQASQLLDTALTVGGTLYTLGKLAIPSVVEGLFHRRADAILAGREPLRKSETPDRVIIGPTSLASDFAGHREQTDRLVVVVHNGAGIPQALGDTVDYHFPVSDFGDLKSARLIREAGMDRSKRLTFLCIDLDKGIFYGGNAQPVLSPNRVSSILRSLPAQALNDLQVDVLLSKGYDFLGQTTAVVEEFAELEKELGVSIRWKYLEDVVLDEFSALLAKIRARKDDPAATVNLLLAGEGAIPKDKQMLARFAEALRGLDTGVNVTVVDNDSIGELTSETAPEKRSFLEKLLKESDLNIVYGDTDDGTTEVAELLIRARGAERPQTVTILESEAAAVEANRAGLLVLPLYQQAILSLK